MVTTVTGTEEGCPFQEGQKLTWIMLCSWVKERIKNEFAHLTEDILKQVFWDHNLPLLLVIKVQRGRN